MKISRKKAKELLHKKRAEFEKLLDHCTYTSRYDSAYDLAYSSTEMLIKEIFSQEDMMEFRRSVYVTGFINTECGYKRNVLARGGFVSGDTPDEEMELRDYCTHLRHCIAQIQVLIERLDFVNESEIAISGVEHQTIRSSKPVDVFISYSIEDRDIAEDLANRLRAFQLIVFMAHDTITAGPAWRLQVGAALRRCIASIVLLSVNSLQSDWVRYEIGALWALNKPVAPALLHCDVTQLPELLREYQARSVATASDRTVFCHEVERLVRETRINETRNA